MATHKPPMGGNRLTHALMARQYGLITRTQAKAAGLPERRIDHLVNTTTWVAVERSVFRHASTPASFRQKVLAATLATNGVASHLTALALMRLLPTSSAGPVTVTIDHRNAKRKLRNGDVRRTTQWRSRQCTTLFGIPATGPERTLIDVAGLVSVDRLERFAEDAVRRQQTTFDRLAKHLVLNGRRGRPGSANLRTMLERRDPQARLPLSDFSRIVYQALAAAGLPEPVVEHRILDASGRFIMQADFAWPERMKAVELDGLAWHFGRTDVERDRRKRARARAEGWRIQEVLWSMLDNRRELLDLLARFLTA